MEQEISIWDLLYSLDPTKRNRCEAIDPLLAERIDSVDTLGLTGYYLNYDGLIEILVKTKSKINEVIQKDVQDLEQSITGYQLKQFDKWLDTFTRKLLVELWIKNDKSWDISWISKLALDLNNEIQIKVFGKLIESYNKRKSRYRVRDVENIFKVVNKDSLDTCCKSLAESSPALTACLLSRPDIQEEYVILGLKALSKLSKQRELPVEVDFFALKTLGPRSRLDAMKQLLGISQTYNKYRKDELPFKIIPTKEEVEEFLFSCAIKYNDEVSSVVKRYEELVNKPKSKEVNYG